MKVWFFSDTHNEHERLQVPKGLDAAIHCGDESSAGNAWLNEPEARRFFEWYSALDIPTKIYVPGNHSTAVEQGLLGAGQFPQLHFLVHAQMQWKGLQIFGSPYTPKFYDWAYMCPRAKLNSVWQTIPDRLDILITHGPPKGLLDVTHDFETGQPIHVGCAALYRHVTQRIKPRIHAFGHIHDERGGIRNFGTLTRGRTQFINCSCCNLAGRLTNHGIVVDIDP